jgi:siroheme synthase
MGLNKLVHLSQRLLASEISPEINVQILSKVSQSDATSFESTLGSISQLLENEKPPMPALVIIGKNVERLSK